MLTCYKDSEETTDLNGSRSEASNVSVGSAIGEDVRQLKDMKAKISEKNTPSSILSLQRITLIIGAVLIALTGNFSNMMIH